MRRLVLSLSLSLLLSLAPAFAEPPPKTTKQALAKLVANAKLTHSDTLLVVRDGKVLLDYRKDDAAPRPIELMSVTKGFVGLAVGMLLRDGKIASLDTPVHTFFPEWKQGRKEKITLRMLMNHTSGLQNVPNTAVEIYPAKDGLQLALAAELDAEPGSSIAYNNKAVNLLAGVIAKAAGMPIDAYLRQTLFDPMDIQPGDWDRDAAGNRRGMAGLPLRASDVAKVGQLVLEQGRWQEKQLLPAEFVREMLAPQPLSDEFGLLWFLRPAWLEASIATRGIERLRAAGCDARVLDALSQLQDQRFASPAAFYSAVGSKLGGDGRQRVQRELAKLELKNRDVIDFRIGPRVYELDGSFGQFLVIAPGANVIAVRQIEYREGLTEADEYGAFVEHVGELAATFDASYRQH